MYQTDAWFGYESCTVFTGKVGEPMTSLALKMYKVCRVNDDVVYLVRFGLVLN